MRLFGLGFELGLEFALAALPLAPDAAILPAGSGQLGAPQSVASAGRIGNIVTFFAQRETHVATVFGMLQILAEIAGQALRVFIDADELDRPIDPVAAILKAEHRRHVDGDGERFDPVTGDLADLLQVPLGVEEAFEVARLENDVGQDAMDAVLHLAGEAVHHRVHHDHRGDAERDAHDGSQRNPARAQIAPAEQEFVHLTVLG